MLSGDTDGDGIPDDVELANGMNPSDPVDGLEDYDRDGLTNKQELDLGTELRKADTDGDGLIDGREVTLGTDPLLVDTDGDGLSDGLEVSTGSDPRDPNSFNLGAALQGIDVAPTTVVLVVNSLIGEASRQVRVVGRLIDGTSLDLTSSGRGTTYTSSNLQIVNFGGTDGLLFAGQDGSATVTVRNSGHTVPVTVTVRSFTPTALSYLSITGFANNVDVSGDYAYVAAGTGGLQIVNVADRRNPFLAGGVRPPGNANDVRVVGNMAYVAAGVAGLHVIDCSNPLAPVLVGTFDTPGDASDVVVRGTRAYVADGSAGLRIIDVSDPQHPALVGSFDTPGTAGGVDVAGTIAVVADGGSGIRVLDVSNPSNPQSRGTLATTSAYDVTLDGTTAYVADYTGSMRVVDVSTPSAPRLLATTPGTTGGYLLDVAKVRQFTFGADVYFVNGVPITDVSTQASPVSATRLDFPARDDDGTGIAVDNSFVYLTANRGIGNNGTTGDSRLYIGQYLELTDEAAIAPTVRITAPAPGSTFVAGTTVTIRVDAADDVGVASVSFTIDGVTVATDSAPPYELSHTIPPAATTRTIGARAVDYGGNESSATPVTVNVTPDPVPAVVLTSPVQGVTATEDTYILLEANASDNVRVDHVRFVVNGAVATTLTTPPYRTQYRVPTGVSSLDIAAVATDNLGQTAQDGRQIAVTAALVLTPDASKITAGFPGDGYSEVVGIEGAVTSGLSVEVTNLTTGLKVVVSADGEGSFSTRIAAVGDDILAIVAVDGAGRRSDAVYVSVPRTPPIPPAGGATLLRYEGLLADRVGEGRAALVADGQADGVFTVGVSIGEGISRQLAWIDLQGPSLRSTRNAVGAILGVAQDVAAPLANRAGDGEASFSVTSRATFTLFTAAQGFIVDGATYTVTLGFTDNSRFVGTFTIVAPDDRPRVAHSLRISAEPPTVVVREGAPGTAVLTLTDIRDIDGALVPDGGRVAIAVSNMASRDPRGAGFGSAGGTIVDGDPAPNNASFRVFTILDGTVVARYSSQPITPGLRGGATTLVQIQGADRDGNVLGTEAVATLDLAIKDGRDPALVQVAPSSLYGDKTDRRSHVVIAANVPDGTKVAVSAVNCASRDHQYNYYCTESAGGTILGGTASPSGPSYRVLTVVGGRAECDYSSSGLFVPAGQTRVANVQVVAADVNGTVTSTAVLGLTGIALTGASRAEVALSPESVPAISPSPEVRVEAHHIHDSRSNLVPDGARVLVSAKPCATRDFQYNYYCTESAGGEIINGTTSASGAGFRVFTLTNEEVVATYTPEGVFNNPGEVKTANIQVAMGDAAGNLLETRPYAVRSLRVVAPSNAVPSALPPSLVGNAGVHTSAARFAAIIDAYGNPIPAGSRIIVSAADCAARDAQYDYYCVPSAGGQVLEGTASPSGAHYKVLTVQGGDISVTYADQNVIAGPGQVRDANVVLLQARPDGSVMTTRVLSTLTIKLAGVTSVEGRAEPNVLHADGSDRRAVLTLMNVRDALGKPVPEGTLLAISAKNCATRDFQYEYYCTGSAGGSILGGSPAPFGSAGDYKLFPVVNGQVVFEYSAAGLSFGTGEQTAVVQAMTVTPAGNAISYKLIGSVPIRLVVPVGGTLSLTPGDLMADTGDRRAQVSLSNLVDTSGVVIPDGTKIALSAKDCAARDYQYEYYCINSVGGELLSAGTTTGDGLVSPNDAKFRVFTVAGGEVRAIYTANTLAAGVNDTKTVRVVAVSASDTGAVVTHRAFATGTLNLRGVTSAAGSGPTTISRAGGTATITFNGIKDSAGNTVPDGTLVLATATHCATRDSTSEYYCTDSVGGTIVDGGASGSGGQYKVFEVRDGSVTVTYSAAGAGLGTARIQLAAAKPDGRLINTKVLAGGAWAINVTN